jgi:hypothetical protein
MIAFCFCKFTHYLLYSAQSQQKNKKKRAKALLLPLSWPALSQRGMLTG